MSRKYGNIMTAIWKDDDFLALPSSVQRTYLMLATQGEISAAGTLPLRIGRWSKKAPDTTPGSVREDIAFLEHHRYVVVDEISEELLVRSFIRWDGGYGNIKRIPVIKRAVSDVESEMIRKVLAEELERLGLSVDEPPDGPDGDRRVPSQLRRQQPETPGGCPESRETDTPDNPSDGSTFPQPNSLSHRHPNTHGDAITPSDGVVVTHPEWEDPTTHNPHPSSPPQPHGRARRVIAELGADDDETNKIINKIQTEYQPRDLGAYTRRLADTGDLDAILQEIRSTRAIPEYTGTRCHFQPDESGISCAECDYPKRHPRHQTQTHAA